MFQDRDEYGEVGEGVRDLVEMTIKKMDLDRYFFLHGAFSNLLQINNEDPWFQGRAHLLLWLQHDGEPRAAAAGGIWDVSTHQPAGDGLGQEDSGQAVRQYVRIKDILLHIYRILHTKLEIYMYKFCKNNNLMGFKHIFYITFIIFYHIQEMKFIKHIYVYFSCLQI